MPSKLTSKVLPADSKADSIQSYKKRKRSSPCSERDVQHLFESTSVTDTTKTVKPKSVQPLNREQVKSTRVQSEQDETRYITQAVATRNRLQPQMMPRNSNCFYHCLNHFQPKGCEGWRKAIAAELSDHRKYYTAFLTKGTFNDHLNDVLNDGWADHQDATAAANILQRVLIVFKKESKQHPAIILPTVAALENLPIYFELDETIPGCACYDLLTLEDSNLNTADLVGRIPPAIKTDNQSSLKQEHHEHCKQLLIDDPSISYHKLGQNLHRTFNLAISKSSLRRLHTKLKQDMGQGAKRLTADDLQANYYDYASEQTNINPSLSWYQLRARLEKDHNVTSSDGNFKRFYDILPSKCLPLMNLNDLRERFSDIALTLMKERNWNNKSFKGALKSMLRQEHKVTAHDSSISTFLKELIRMNGLSRQSESTTCVSQSNEDDLT